MSGRMLWPARSDSAEGRLLAPMAWVKRGGVQFRRQRRRWTLVGVIGVLMAGDRLTLGEREQISRGIARAESIATIARRLGRVTLTVSREMKRDGGSSWMSGLIGRVPADALGALLRARQQRRSSTLARTRRLVCRTRRDQAPNFHTQRCLIADCIGLG